MQLSADDHARVRAAIKAAEATTSGEIFAILTQERHRYTGFALSVAAFIAFVLPFAAVALGFGPAAWLAVVRDAGWLAGDADLADRRAIELYAALQLALFVGIAALLWLTPLSQRLAPRFLRHDRVHELALRQFLAKGIHLTEGRTGVLLFVSVADRISEVVADKGIYEKVPPETWAETNEALLRGLRAGDPARAFEEAIAIAGAVLAAHFPPCPKNPNELDDRLIEL
ncbi:TPM domain-containing protein [Sandaracinobacteroides saxicola]|uniref:TPM domain-containing protein n=1 Tax=Sandaracinobacteroides saxicola TaxID=2759707 RepID=A0A7G5IGX3_9SPHN|nr:TPM domain-containing protein [Sandaracinobacteroides saxicola]QMW22615.1 TPM domain-containing protein [Sandaracinobacteroides saxicola]